MKSNTNKDLETQQEELKRKVYYSPLDYLNYIDDYYVLDHLDELDNTL